MKVEIHSTTILSVRRGPRVVVAGDGQVTLGNTVVKGGAKKVRRLGDGRAIGSGGGYALAAARALMQRTELEPRAIAETAMQIAAEICIYTNTHLTIEELP